MSSSSTGYTNALQVCAAILAMVLFGFFWRALNMVGPSSALVKAFNSYMFLVGIPCLVFRALSLQDFSRMPWAFIAVFAFLRVSLFAMFFVVDFLLLRRSLGVFVADYMNSTWINTVIFGIPIYIALFGPQFAVYPVFASISSFFFQLPVQLILFEVDDHLQQRHFDGSLARDWDVHAFPLGRLRRRCRGKGGIVVHILVSVLVNPIMVAIVAGFIFSATKWTLPIFLNTFCEYSGNAVTPLAAFAIGVFMYQKLPLEKTLWLSIVLDLVVKFFVMPLLVMPFLLAMGIEGIPRQMGVLMAALPIALSCYVLSVRYRRNEQHAALLVILTTILILPTQLMWIGSDFFFFSLSLSFHVLVHILS